MFELDATEKVQVVTNCDHLHKLTLYLTRHNKLALGLALMLNVGFLVLMLGVRPLGAPANQNARSTIYVTLNNPAPTLPQTPMQASKLSAAIKRSMPPFASTAVQGAPATVSNGPSPVLPSDPAIPTASATAAWPATSGGLRLDDAVVKQAVRQAHATRARPPLDALSREAGKADPQSALSTGIQQAARGDCKQAHAQMGLLALPMLLWDSVQDNGCRW